MAISDNSFEAVVQKWTRALRRIHPCQLLTREIDSPSKIELLLQIGARALVFDRLELIAIGKDIALAAARAQRFESHVRGMLDAHVESAHAPAKRRRSSVFKISSMPFAPGRRDRSGGVQRCAAVFR